MMDTVLKLYYNDGTNDVAFPYGMEQAELHDFTVSKTRMGTAPTISATLEYPTCLDNEWAHYCHFDDIFVTFNGEKFYLKSTPTSSKDNTNLFYKHELQFVSERVVLETVYMLDDNENQTANILYSNNTKYTFFGNLAAFVERINQSMYFSEIGDTCMYNNGEIVPVGSRTLNGDGFYVVVDASVTSTDEVLITLSNNKVSDALKQIFEKYGVPYYFVGRVCHIGEYQPVVEATPTYADGNGVLGAGLNNGSLVPYEYGAPNSVLQVTRSNQTKQIYNRCSGTGSSDNIPYYYPNQTSLGNIYLEMDSGNTGSCESVEIVSPKLLAENAKSLDAEIKNIPRGTAVSGISCRVSKDYDGDYSSASQIFDITHTETEIEEGVIHIKYVMDSYLTVYARFGIASTGSGILANSFTPVLKLFDPDDSDRFVIVQNSKTRYLKYEPPAQGFGIVSNGVYYNKDHDCFYYAIVANGSRTNVYIAYGIESEYYKLLVKSSGLSHTIGVELSATYNIQDTYYTIDSNLGEAGEAFFINDMIGLGNQINGSMNYGDKMYVRLENYIQPQQNLMPRCYRESDGTKRFYQALNYPLDTASSTPDEEMGDTVVGTAINNPYYENANKQYYNFDNPWRRLKQKEHIYDLGDIKPTIKEMTNNDFRRIDMFADIAFDDNDDNSYTTDDNGNIEYNHPYFFVKLRRTDGYYGFNLFDHAIDEQEMTISMTSGKCAPCEFTIMVDKDSMKNLVQVDSNGNLLRDEDGDVRCGRKREEVAQDRQNDTENYEVWIALRKDIETYGEIMPFNDGTVRLFPSICSQSNVDDGDTFVILHIELPEAYVLASEDKLSKEIVKNMCDDNSENFNKSLKYSRVFLGGNQPLVTILNENIKVSTRYNGTNAECFVSSYSYAMKSSSPIPEITITGLVEDAKELGGGSAKGVFSSINESIENINDRLKKENENINMQLRKTNSMITKGNVIVNDTMPYRRLVLSAGGNDITYLPNGADGKYLKMVDGNIVWDD